MASSAESPPDIDNGLSQVQGFVQETGKYADKRLLDLAFPDRTIISKILVSIHDHKHCHQVAAPEVQGTLDNYGNLLLYNLMKDSPPIYIIRSFRKYKKKTQKKLTDFQRILHLTPSKTTICEHDKCPHCDGTLTKHRTRTSCVLHCECKPFWATGLCSGKVPLWQMPRPAQWNKKSAQKWLAEISYYLHSKFEIEEDSKSAYVAMHEMVESLLPS